MSVSLKGILIEARNYFSTPNMWLSTFNTNFGRGRAHLLKNLHLEGPPPWVRPLERMINRKFLYFVKLTCTGQNACASIRPTANIKRGQSRNLNITIVTRLHFFGVSFSGIDRRRRRIWRHRHLGSFPDTVLDQDKTGHDVSWDPRLRWS